MPVHNTAIAACFNKLADLLEIEAANAFRVRAYRNAARTIADLPQSVAEMVADGADLSSLPGIGQDLAAKIIEIVDTGTLKLLRLDPPAMYCKMAKEMGLKMAISTDAHSVNDLDLMRFGVDQARRGWLEADDVLNTRSWKALQELLERK